MVKIKLYWAFFKSTLIMNMAVSFFISFIVYFSLKEMSENPPAFLNLYIKICIFGGPLISFYYKEITRKPEYYFYYNKGISKLNLIIATLLIYILLGFILLNILRYAKLA
jgi:hypothetical protein